MANKTETPAVHCNRRICLVRWVKMVQENQECFYTIKPYLSCQMEGG